LYNKINEAQEEDTG